MMWYFPFWKQLKYWERGKRRMSEFEQYVQRYAKCYHISIEEAKTHALVKEVEKHYNGTDKDVNKWW